MDKRFTISTKYGRFILNNSLHKAFTLIEVLISVIILSGSIVYVLKLHSNTRNEITYVMNKNKFILQDSLFISKKALNYNQDEKSAYDIISQDFKVDDLKSREMLKNIDRKINIPEPINISHENSKIYIPDATIQEIKIKGQYSSEYFHFDITSL